MEMLLVLAFSFGGAVAVGYLGVFFEKGARSVSESELGSKIGRWLFLFPLLDVAERGASRAFEWAHKGKDIHGLLKMDEVGKKLNSILLTIAHLGLILIVGAVAISIVVWLFLFIFLDYLFELILAGALIGGAYYLSKKR